ncbi:antitoxin [Methylobacterium symbioticum]|uniref:Antitoxin VapB1 n=1 Tax=Methylobacterium symbioticum TaxID=2584084 RepID=A0A509EMB7_9HYPH|nr:AbrB/MazE/SpoVT family DNA-binding domain-containing protein [Methylobacterium symbioticum]VUD74639.1 Antitoxin VapB1 [Methylobacterium symbioticum]
MARTRIFRSGNSQAVRIPREFRLSGTEVEIFRRGGEIVLREVRDPGLAAAFELLAELPPEIDDRADAPPQEREGL